MQLYYKQKRINEPIVSSQSTALSENFTLLITYFFYTIGQDSNPNNASKARKTKQRKCITAKYVPHLQTYETEADLVLTEPTGLYIVR